MNASDLPLLSRWLLPVDMVDKTMKLSYIKLDSSFEPDDADHTHYSDSNSLCCVMQDCPILCIGSTSFTFLNFRISIILLTDFLHFRNIQEVLKFRRDFMMSGSSSKILNKHNTAGNFGYTDTPVQLCFRRIEIADICLSNVNCNFIFNSIATFDHLLDLEQRQFGLIQMVGSNYIYIVNGLNICRKKGEDQIITPNALSIIMEFLIWHIP